MFHIRPLTGERTDQKSFLLEKLNTWASTHTRTHTPLHQKLSDRVGDRRRRKKISHPTLLM
jgi:hypothetical protein